MVLRPTCWWEIASFWHIIINSTVCKFNAPSDVFPGNIMPIPKIGIISVFITYPCFRKFRYHACPKWNRQHLIVVSGNTVLITFIIACSRSVWLGFCQYKSELHDSTNHCTSFTLLSVVEHILRICSFHFSRYNIQLGKKKKS